MIRISESSTGRAVKVRGLLLLLLAVCLLVLTGPGFAMVTGAGVGASAVVPEAIEHSLTAQRYDVDATIDQRAVRAHGDDVRDAYDAAGHLAKNVTVACPVRHSFQPSQPLCDATKRTPHKNSLDYVGETHVYRVKGPNGNHKIGESAQGTRVRDGASIRAEQQARKLTRQTGDRYSTDIRKTFPDKRSARGYETRLIERFRRRYGQDALPGNKTNR